MKFTHIARGVSRIALAIGQPAAGAAILRSLIDVLARSAALREVLTPAHAEWARLALHAKECAGARAVLERPMLSVGGKLVSKDSFGTSATDVLLYFYYGGCLMCGAGAWALAVDLFRTCLVLPGASVSAIQVEAFKKLCIAEVMAHGDDASLQLPAATNAAVAKVLSVPAIVHYKTLAQEVAACAAPARIAELIARHGAAYTSEGNAELVQALVVFGDRLRLRKLTRVYASLPMEEAARKAGLSSGAEAARMLKAMIAEDGLAATVDETAQVVRFAPGAGSIARAASGSSSGAGASPAAAAGAGAGASSCAAGVAPITIPEEELVARLEAELEATKLLVDRLQDTDAAVHLSRPFLVRDAMAGKGGGGGGSGGLDSPPRGGGGAGGMGFGGFGGAAGMGLGMGVDYDDEGESAVGAGRLL